MRENRAKHSELTPEQRQRANTRSYTNVMIRRGEIEREPCAVCGSADRVQAHHVDYADPFLVFFLCASCHHAEHAAA